MRGGEETLNTWLALPPDRLRGKAIKGFAGRRKIGQHVTPRNPGTIVNTDPIAICVLLFDAEQEFAHGGDFNSKKHFDTSTSEVIVASHIVCMAQGIRPLCHFFL